MGSKTETVVAGSRVDLQLQIKTNHGDLVDIGADYIGFVRSYPRKHDCS